MISCTITSDPDSDVTGLLTFRVKDILILAELKSKLAPSGVRTTGLAQIGWMWASSQPPGCLQLCACQQ